MNQYGRPHVIARPAGEELQDRILDTLRGYKSVERIIEMRGHRGGHLNRGAAMTRRNQVSNHVHENALALPVQRRRTAAPISAPNSNRQVRGYGRCNSTPRRCALLGVQDLELFAVRLWFERHHGNSGTRGKEDSSGKVGYAKLVLVANISLANFFAILAPFMAPSCPSYPPWACLTSTQH